MKEAMLTNLKAGIMEGRTAPLPAKKPTLYTLYCSGRVSVLRKSCGQMQIFDFYSEESAKCALELCCTCMINFETLLDILSKV